MEIDNNKKVKKLFVCHNVDLTYSLLNDCSKVNFDIIFVGNVNFPQEFLSNPRIIIARNFPYNIEEEKDLLTFTAWYLIIKNNLFTEFEYVCILEYDVLLYENFETKLDLLCNANTNDVITFWPVSGKEFLLDHANRDVMESFLKTKNIPFKIVETWYGTTNHCLRRNILEEFVDWYYPSCHMIKILDPKYISWYHERMFSFYILNKKYKIEILQELWHQFSNSHIDYHDKKPISQDIPENLISLFKENSGCEFLKKLICNYSTFLELNNPKFTPGIGSYFIDGQKYSYDSRLYSKQLLFFNEAKNAKNILLVGNYMAHNLFIVALANPNSHITCFETNYINEQIFLLQNKFNLNINFYVKSKIVNIFQSFDLVHICQQHPTREYLNDYIDVCILKTTNDKIKFIIDDYDAYPLKIIEQISTNNPHCSIVNTQYADCIYRNCCLEIFINKTEQQNQIKTIICKNESNFKKDLNISNNKKYVLLYDDDSGAFKDDLVKLIISIKKFSDFEIIVFHRNDFREEFVEKNKNILNQYRGGGYWLWKPYIINETLKRLRTGDLLFYVDSKYYFTENFTDLYKDIFNVDNNLLLWKNKPNESSYFLKNWCKRDVVQKYNMEDGVYNKNVEACWAGAILLKKNSFTDIFVNEWLGMCCCDDITDRPSFGGNTSDFIDHRHDQSLLSILVHKYNINLHTFEKKYLQNVRIPY
jgi:hypothetical protein